MLPGFRTDDAIATDDNMRRQRQQRMFQTGLLICFLLLLMDPGSKTVPPNGNDDSSSQPGYPLKESLKATLAAVPLEDGTVFSQNVTGYYRGKWVTMNSTEASSEALTSAAKFPESLNINMSKNEGNVGFQLWSQPMLGLEEEVSMVQGHITLIDGTFDPLNDIMYNVQGVFLHRFGRLIALASTEGSQVKLVWPKQQYNITIPVNTDDNNGLTDDSITLSNGIRRLNAAFSGENQDFPTSEGFETRVNYFKEGHSHHLLGDFSLGSRNRRQIMPSVGIDPIDNSSENRDSIQILSDMNQMENLRHDHLNSPNFLQLEPVYSESNIDSFHFQEELYDRIIRQREILPYVGFEFPTNRLLNLIPGRNLIGSLGETYVTGDPYHFVPLPVKIQTLDTPIDETQNSMILPIHGSLITSRSNTNEKNCMFSMDFEANVLNQYDSISSDTAAGSNAALNSAWVSSLNGNWVGLNCEFSAVISATALRTNWEKAYPKAVNYSVVITLICLMQIGLLFRQLYHSNTQASASKVSLLCIGQQAILDALICIAHLLLCAFMQPLFFPLVSVAFFKLVNFCIFEMRFLILVYQSRQPQSFFDGGWHAMRNELAVLHGRFYLALFSSLAFIWFLYKQMAFLVFVLYSFWVPQIVSNAIRDNKNSLHPVYLIGISMTRIVLPMYVYGCPQNFISVVSPKYEPMYQECILLVLWVSFQVFVLLAQDIFGPQFFIPQRFLPQKYNYYRPVPNGSRFDEGGDAREMDIESGNAPECAICYNTVDPAEGTHMVTPCDHCFHSECLQQWINIKMECPTCRATLPPT